VSEAPPLALSKSGRLALMFLCSAADIVLVLALLGVWHRLQRPLLLASTIVILSAIAIAIRAGAKTNNRFFGSALCLALASLGIGVYMWFLSVSSLTKWNFHSTLNPLIGALALLPAFYFSQLGTICLFAVLVGRPSARLGTRRVYKRLLEPVFRGRARSRNEDRR
jgi:hypothetical protein